jgi:uncharacterized protein (DUF1800 family)
VQGDDIPLKPLAIEAGLESYTAPLDQPHATHLLRRTGFGARPGEIDALMGMDVQTAIPVIVEAAINAPLPDPPVWANEAVPRRNDAQSQAYIQNNGEWMLELRGDWFRQMYMGGLRERLTLFWHNHFVTEADTYLNLAVYAYRYVNTLRTHAVGNFKDFVHAIGTDPAMLYYLNGAQSVAGAPNENYARELLELFTMGEFDAEGHPNYTQDDIQEIARALTGWVPDPFSLTVQHVNVLFDNSEKTIFGRTGAWGYDDVVDILFEERGPQIATFICRKLYQAFVYEAPDESLVSDLADVFVASNYDLAPVLNVLLQSAHFMDEEAIGAQIKSPATMVVGLLQEVLFETPPDNLFLFLDRFAVFMQQRILYPPNVAGWEEHHTWLNTTTLPLRWLVSEFLIYGSRNEQAIDLVPLAEHLLGALDTPLDPSDPKSVFALPLALAEHLLPVPPETLDLNPPSEGFGGDLDNFPIPQEVLDGPAHVADLAKIFLVGVPWYEWSLYRPEAAALLLYFTRYLTQTPEFQLT